MASFDEVNKIWSGPKIVEEQKSFIQELFKNLHKTPNKIAQISIFEKTELTYNELRLLSIRAAQNLLDLGVKPGDVIGFIAKNSTYLAPITFGCFLIGAPINPLDAVHQLEDYKHLWGITRPKIIFCDPDKLDLVQEAIKFLNLNAKVFTFLENIEGFLSVEEVLKETGNEDNFM